MLLHPKNQLQSLPTTP
jgi:hypothetical protein